jgi:rod shape-determining protein MreC
MLVLASVTVVTLDYHGEASRGINHVRNGIADAVAPLQRAVQDVLHPVGDLVAAPFHYGSLQTENAELQREIGDLQRSAAEQQYGQNLVKEVQLLGNVSFAANIPLLPAEVIAPSSSNFQPTVEIGIGTSSGVGKGMPVVTGGGLLGTVESASSSTATVLLVSDSRQSIEVADQAGDVYEVSGQGAGRPLTLQSFGATRGTLRPGEKVFTLGQVDGAPATAFPAGIPVGSISSTRTSAGGITAATVAPLADLGALYVAVMEWTPPA